MLQDDNSRILDHPAMPVYKTKKAVKFSADVEEHEVDDDDVVNENTKRFRKLLRK